MLAKCSPNKPKDDKNTGASPPRTVFMSKDNAKKAKTPPPVLDANCYCSITQEVMTDPVIAMDGFTYERAAITEWLKNNNTSPQTNLALPSKALIPNHAIKSMIAEYEFAVKMGAQYKKPPAKEEEKVDADSTSPEDIAIDVNATVDRQGLVKISVLAEESQVNVCPPVDVVLIMDRSGSMSTACVGVDEDTGTVQENGFSTLDLVKHAMKTCVESLRDCDRCALILFDNEIIRSSTFTKMDRFGRKMASTKIDVVKERGSTNIYGAILEGIKVVEERADTSRNPSILFFTDGCPNLSPARGEREAFKKVKRTMCTKVPVHTFGFGTWRDVDSSLLFDIASIFNGFNGYIADATSLGTTFVNAISNVMTTAAVDVKFHLIGKESMLAVPHVGEYPYGVEEGDDGETVLTVNLGTIRFGQTTDFVLEFPDKLVSSFPEYKVTYETGGKIFESQPKRTLQRGTTAVDHMMRFKTIELLKKVIQEYRMDLDGTRALVKKHIDEFEKARLADKVSQGILANLKGQNTKMLKKEKYMNKWGKHQTRQYLRSLNLQIKNNFKDPGVQNFGGKLFLKLSDQVDDIFNNMPPPKPTLATKATKVITNSKAFASAYNNANNDYINGHGNTSGGCFSGNGCVAMADGSFKLVRDIVPGDVVYTPEGPSEVALVRRDELPHAGCLVNGLWITPKHPVRVDKRWMSPLHLWEVSPDCPNTEWFNIELRGGNSFYINGIELVALGHDNVIPSDHPAYSAEKDAQYGRGWMKNPERAVYLKRAVAEAYKALPAVQVVENIPRSLPVF